MYKIGMIGNRAEALGFMSLGFTVIEANTAEEAAAGLMTLCESGEYAVIFLTESLAAGMGETLSRYKDAPLPAITLIPGGGSTAGAGLARLREAVKRAVGADILFKE